MAMQMSGGPPQSESCLQSLPILEHPTAASASVELIESLKGKAFYPRDRAGKVDYSVEAMKKVSGLFFQELDALASGRGLRDHALDEFCGLVLVEGEGLP